jgi:hypothetical protein
MLLIFVQLHPSAQKHHELCAGRFTSRDCDLRKSDDKVPAEMTERVSGATALLGDSICQAHEPQSSTAALLEGAS